MSIVKIGTKEIQKCFDGKNHEVTVSDYLVKLYGNTYHNRSLMHTLCFMWDAANKYWFKNVCSDKELEQIDEAIEGKNIKVYVEPIWRITDNATNPIEY